MCNKICHLGYKQQAAVIKLFKGSKDKPDNIKLQTKHRNVLIIYSANGGIGHHREKLFTHLNKLYKDKLSKPALRLKQKGR